MRWELSRSPLFDQERIRSGKTAGDSVHLCCIASGTASARADAVVDWNAITAEAIGKAMGAGRPGQTTLLDFAMVHAAIHDAVQAIEKRFDPYHVAIPGAKGSPAAAAAKAAHDVLVTLFPEQAGSLDMSYDKYLSAHGIARDDPGSQVGQQAAAGILARRENDGRYPAGFPAFNGGTGPGMWRPTPPQHASMAVPWLSAVKPFTLNSPSQFRAEPPPRMDSSRYARDYDEVKALGAAKGDPHARADRSRLLLGGQLRGRMESRATGASRPLTSRPSGTAHGCSRWPTLRRQTPRSPPGTPRGITSCGGPSRPSRRARTTGIRERPAIAAGSRSCRRQTILTIRRGPTS